MAADTTTLIIELRNHLDTKLSQNHKQTTSQLTQLNSHISTIQTSLDSHKKEVSDTFDTILSRLSVLETQQQTHNAQITTLQQQPKAEPPADEHSQSNKRGRIEPPPSQHMTQPTSSNNTTQHESPPRILRINGFPATTHRSERLSWAKAFLSAHPHPTVPPQLIRINLLETYSRELLLIFPTPQDAHTFKDHLSSTPLTYSDSEDSPLHIAYPKHGKAKALASIMTRTKILLTDHLTSIHSDTDLTPPKPDVCHSSGAIYINRTKVAYINITGEYDTTTKQHPATITALTKNAEHVKFNTLSDFLNTVTTNILNKP